MPKNSRRYTDAVLADLYDAAYWQARYGREHHKILMGPSGSPDPKSSPQAKRFWDLFEKNTAAEVAAHAAGWEESKLNALFIRARHDGIIDAYPKSGIKCKEWWLYLNRMEGSEVLHYMGRGETPPPDDVPNYVELDLEHADYIAPQYLNADGKSQVLLNLYYDRRNFDEQKAVMVALMMHQQGAFK